MATKPVSFTKATLAFIVGNLSSWFVFYVGGGEMFTADAGVAGACGIVLGLMAISIYTAKNQGAFK